MWLFGPLGREGFLPKPPSPLRGVGGSKSDRSEILCNLDRTWIIVYSYLYPGIVHNVVIPEKKVIISIFQCAFDMLQGLLLDLRTPSRDSGRELVAPVSDSEPA